MKQTFFTKNGSIIIR